MSVLLLAAMFALESGPARAVVDRSQATVEDEILLTVVIDDLRAREPELPRIPGARVARRGRQRATQLINGRRTDTISYRYAVYPRREGTLRIPSIPVRVGTKLYETAPLEVQIVSSESPGGLKPFFAIGKVDETRPYRSQQIVYTLQLYGELLNMSCNQVEWPNFDQFIVEDFGQERRFETVRDGRRFRVLELRKALYPLEPGAITIPGAELTCNVTYPSTRGALPGGFDRLFSQQRTETKVLRTQPITLDVRALPPPPADFSNIVGRVELNASMSERRLVAGSSATQTLYVQSDGNLRGFEPPRPDLESVKVYDDQAEIRITDRGSHLQSLMQMNRAFVPVEAGQLVVPGLAFSYFDPETGRYERASAPSFTLDVAPNPDAESLRLVDGIRIDDKQEVAVARETLMPYAAAPTLGLRAPPVWAVLLVGLLPPLMLVLSTVRVRRKTRQTHEPLRKVLAPLRDGGDAETVESVIRDVLARGGEHFRALTANEIDGALEPRGIPEGDRGAATEWMRWAEQSRYGAGGAQPPSSLSELSELLSRLCRRLERPS